MSDVVCDAGRPAVIGRNEVSCVGSQSSEAIDKQLAQFVAVLDALVRDILSKMNEYTDAIIVLGVFGRSSIGFVEGYRLFRPGAR